MSPENKHSSVMLSEILKESDTTLFQSLLSDQNPDWFNFMEFSGNRLVTPTVARKLCTPELTPLIPAEVVDALQMVRHCNLTRNQRLVDTFVRVTDVLNQGDVYPLPLKGVSLLLRNIYADQSERVVGDIDILIHPSEVRKSLNLLRQQGFVQRCNPFLGDEGHQDNRFEPIDVDDFRHIPSSQNYHLPPIKEHLDAEFYVEIHTRPCFGNDAMEAELNRLACNFSYLVAEGRCRYRQPGLSFTLMHTAHHMLIQDKLLYLGLTDYRHLLDIDRLLKRIADNGETDQLLELARNAHFSELFTFLVWRCENTLDVKYDMDFAGSPTGNQWIADFNKTSKSAIRRKMRLAMSTTRDSLPRLLSNQALHHAFGDMALKKAAPLYLRYQYKRALKAIKSAFS